MANILTQTLGNTQTHGMRQDIITLHIFSTESLGGGNQLHEHLNFICKIPLEKVLPTSALEVVPADFPDIESLLPNISLKIKGHVVH